jgi:hypothetical protein
MRSLKYKNPQKTSSQASIFCGVFSIFYFLRESLSLPCFSSLYLSTSNRAAVLSSVLKSVLRACRFFSSLFMSQTHERSDIARYMPSQDIEFNT